MGELLGNRNTLVTNDHEIHLQVTVADVDHGDGALAGGDQDGQEWGRCYKGLT